MRILVVVNDPICGGGVVAEELERLGHTLDERQPHHGTPMPASPAADYDALLALGGAMSAFDDADYPTLRDVAETIAAFTEADKPVLGICLGAQQVARAFGQEYRQLPVMEYGFIPLTPTGAADSDPLLGGIAVPPIAQLHGDTFVLPPDGTRLLTGSDCFEQAFRVGRATYAFQAHFEVSRTSLDEWFDFLSKQDPERLGPDVDQRLAAFRSQIPDRLDAAQAFGREVTRRWAALAG